MTPDLKSIQYSGCDLKLLLIMGLNIISKRCIKCSFALLNDRRIISGGKALSKTSAYGMINKKRVTMDPRYKTK